MSEVKGKTLIEAAEAISGSGPDAAARQQEFIDACEALENNNTAENRERVRDAWADKGQGVAEGFNDAVGGPIRGPLANEITDALGDVLKRQRDGIDKGYADALDALDEANPGGPGHLGGTERDLCDSLDDALDDVQNIPLPPPSGSPLVLDLDGDGVETTAMSEGVLFDHKGDGFKELSGWVSSDDGLLVLDRNSDGYITSGAELFGNNTQLANGAFASNGFAALQELDSDNNGKIDSNDASWQELRVWRDLDGDGVSQADELFSLEQCSVASISVDYSEISETDNGNAVLQGGSYTSASGEVKAVKDVWFSVSEIYGRAAQGENISQSILDLPGIRGGGHLKDFHTALSESPDFLNQYISFLEGSSSYSEFVEVLFKWANVRLNVSLEDKILDFLRAATGEAVNIPLSADRRQNLRESFAEIAERMYGQHLVGADVAFNDLARNFVYAETNGVWSVDTSGVKAVLEEKVDTNPREALELIQKAQIFARTYGLTDLYSWAGNGSDFISLLFSQESLSQIPQLSSLADANTGPTNIDYIYGSNFADSISTVLGDDVIAAGGGNDSVSSGRGNNKILLGSGDDVISDESGNDFIDGGDGDDSITDNGVGTNTIRGGAGNDKIFLSSGAHNTVDGGIGDDTITVNSPNYAYGATNMIAGGLGNDRIEGGAGADTYLYNRGDGKDVIIDAGFGAYGAVAGQDTLVFGAGISQGDLTVTRNGSDLVITLAGNIDPEVITIKQWFDNDGYRIERFNFADGSYLTKEQVHTLSLSVQGTSAADTLSGSRENNIILGLGGNDVITDEYGSDDIDGGDGDDSITDNGVGTNTIRGGAGNDKIFLSSGAHNTVDGGIGDDTITVNSPNYAYGATNMIAGGLGNDRIEGGAGADTYLYNRGDGKDVIIDAGFGAYGAVAGQDTLVFGAGISQGDLTVTRNGSDLVITLAGNIDPEVITIKQWFDNDGYRIERFNFADGSYLTKEQVHTLSLSVQGTSAADTLSGSRENNIILGLGGNDVITDEYGSDDIDGGDGDDSITDNGVGTNTIRGGAGNDKIFLSSGAHNTVDGGIGDDTITVNSPNYAYGATNMIAGGLGNDRIEGGAGADTYLYNRGDGKDVIIDAGFGAYGAVAGQDTLVFGAGISQGDLTVTRNGSDLVITLAGNIDPEVITIKQWFDNDGYRIERFNFADGSYLTKEQVHTLSLSVQGTSAADTLSGSRENNIILGLGGNDVITDEYGSDDIDGGDGDDSITDNGVGTNTIRGGAGNDKIFLSSGAHNTVDGGIGDDTITVNSPNYAYGATNMIAGGLSNDRIEGGAGADTYLYNRGDGKDVIIDAGFGAYGAVAGQDTLVFGAGISQGDLTVTRNGSDLVITLAGNIDPEVITIKQWFDNDGYRIERFNFADGSYLTKEQVHTLSLSVQGTSAADTLSGSRENNIILGLGGNDVITDEYGSDDIDGGDGDDSITDNGVGTNTIRGGAGNDKIFLSSGAHNTVDGGIGDDTITVNSPNYAYGATNMIAGGLGNDRIEGGAGADTYLYNRGDGKDVIIDAGFGAYGAVAGQDTLVFGAGISQGDLTVTRNGSDLVITLAGNIDPEVITIKQWFDNDGYRIERFNFADGSYLTKEQVHTLSLSVQGTSAADTLSGSRENNIILGLGGNDVITDEYGSDDIDGGDGDDSITDNGVGTNTIRGGAGNDKIFLSSGAHNTVDGGIGDDTITVNSPNYAYGATNMIAGGLGNDRIEGGAGADTYLYNRGDGKDVIIDAGFGAYGAVAGQDTLVFGAGISQGDLTVTRNGSDLVITLAGNIDPEVITIKQWFDNDGYRIERFNFADGSYLTKEQVHTLSLSVQGTSAADTLSGSRENNIILGLGGNDVITDEYGSDDIDGGDGDDSITDNGVGTNTIRGGAGNDKIFLSSGAHNTVDGGIGDDTITVNSPNYAYGATNMIAGGLGNDRIEGGAGADTYLYNRGDGKDVIIDAGFGAYGATAGQDVLVLGDVAPHDVWLTRSGNNLNFQIIAGDGGVTIENWYSGNGFRVESIMGSGGEVLLESQVQNLVDAMAAFGISAGGEVNLTAEQRQQLDIVLAANWQ